jgi:FtsH-binding integral membrane protein
MANIRNQYGQVETGFQTQAVARTFLSGVFMWMFIALGLSAATAYIVGTTPSLISMLINFETGGITVLGWVVMLAPLGLVLLMSAGINRLSATSMVLIFALYAVLVGASLSFILYVYTTASIAKTFVITALMFGTMAFVGYTTKTDLTRLGGFLIMGLVGIIIASVVNWILGSETMDYIISFLGVLIFTGLTAYDVQKLKRIGSSIREDDENTRKMTIYGALTLYLDFINLFLLLLRFFGDRRS